MSPLSVWRVALLVAAAWAQAAVGDDIEIYTSAGVPGSEPMVMFYLDYRPNLGSTICSNVNACAQADYFRSDPATAGDIPDSGKFTLFDMLRLTLKQVFARTDDVKVGLILNHENTCAKPGPLATKCSNGGYIPFGFRRLNADTRRQFNDLLWALPTPTSAKTSHSNQGEERAFELFRYLTGQGVYNGHNGFDDYSLKGAPNLDKDFPEAAWDDAIEIKDGGGNSQYITPLSDAAACGKIFLVNLTFGVLNHHNDSDEAIALPKSSGGMDFPAGADVDYVSVIRKLYESDLADGSFPGIPDLPGLQNVTSYFVSPRDSGLLHDLAVAGGTEAPYPLSDDPEELVTTLENIMAQILSVSSTFVPVSLPINAFNRSEVVDNVFLALFEAQAEGRPTWSGNLKKLKLGSRDADGAIDLIDALGGNAVAVDGRIRNDALTFWTDPTALPLPDPDTSMVAGRDGRFSGRGGAGQKIPGIVAGSPGLANGPGARTLYFDITPSALAPLDANASTATALLADLGAGSSAEAQALIAYARGTDVDDRDGDRDRLEARPWLFGDPLHSRPLAINYGERDGHTRTNPLIYIAVGSNDGFMRLVRNTDTSGAEIGKEVWAFMPREVMGIQALLRANAPSRNHPYGVDGMSVVFKGDFNANGTVDPGEPVMLVFGLRRGGKAYYGVDISNPELPRLRWTIRKGGDFGELGLTFSSPRIGLVETAAGERHALIFGGGYDRNKDLRGGIGTNDTEGNALYVVDLETGALIWKAIRGAGGATESLYKHPDLTDGVASEVTIIDSDGDGLTDRALFGDTGGNVWRADLKGPSANWRLSRIAILGRHGTLEKRNDRRFFHRPDFVASRDELGPFDAVIIGSGDRADPKDVGGDVDNYIFVIKDRHIAAGAAAETETGLLELADVTDNCLQDDSCVDPPDLTAGWRLRLERAGEKVLASPLTIAGTVYITSFVPPTLPPGPATSCKLPEGDGYLYAIGLQNGTARRNYNDTDDPPDAPDEPHSKDDRDVKLLSSGIPAEVVPLPPDKILRPDLVVEDTGTRTRWKTFWYEKENDDL